MSTYTEDGDYWHAAWEESQRALAAMKAELDYIKSGHVDDELYRQLREMKAENERLREYLNADRPGPDYKAEVERLRKLYNKAQDDASREAERRVEMQLKIDRLHEESAVSAALVVLLQAYVQRYGPLTEEEA